MLITGKTRVCGIIGDPVEHSLSPVMHNAAFRELGIDSVYVPFRVLPRLLGEAIRGLRSQGVLGFNVTVPHKIETLKYLQKLDPLAQRIGAVNTVLNTEGRLIGYNTDATGAVEALRQNDVRLDESAFTILGAGGAARAITFALAGISPRIVVLNRTFEKAQRLKREVKRKTQRNIETIKLTRRSLAKVLFTTDVLVNATSIGMESNQDCLPIDKPDLKRDLTVFDIVYGQRETDLLRKAKQAGCKTINGIEMLLHQGAASFKIWTGRKAPLNVMRKGLVRAMEVRANACC